MKFPLFILVLLFFISCKELENTEKQTISENSVSPQANESKIIFLTFHIYTDSIKKINQITLLNKSESNGKLKQTDESQVNSENYLTFKVYENNKLVTTVVKEHPLFKDIEYMNESNALSVKHIELKKDDFFIRLQIKNTSTLKIWEHQKGKTETLLTTIDL